MKKYAFFDVDGTVIAKDSFIRILKWRIGVEPWRALPLLALSPIFLGTYIFGWDRRYAKSALLWSLTCFKPRRRIVHILTREFSNFLLQDWFLEATAELSSLRSTGHSICYVSASGELWLKALLNRADPGEKIIIGSRLGIRFFGLVLTSPNCYGAEKLNRIQQKLGTRIEWSKAYSDHTADLPLLNACNERTIVNPKLKHIGVFEKNLTKPFRQVTWHTQTSINNRHTTHSKLETTP
jgi:phosphatidylglycerophosphatase C